MRRLVLALAIAAGGLVAPDRVLAAEPRAVIELFTSQGCSSCPPADRLAATLATDPSLVVVSLPVDYWDYLGWKDTLASPAFSARQKAYAAARGDRRVYTPQIVVNGVDHVVGSDRGAIEKAMRETRSDPRVLSVPVEVTATDGGYRVDVGAGGAADADVWLMPTLDHADVAIGRGENTGATVRYIHVARGIRKLGPYDGKAASFKVPASAIAAPADGFAVLVQARHGDKPGAILGAASRSAAEIRASQ